MGVLHQTAMRKLLPLAVALSGLLILGCEKHKSPEEAMGLATPLSSAGSGALTVSSTTTSTVPSTSSTQITTSTTTSTTSTTLPKICTVAECAAPPVGCHYSGGTDAEGCPVCGTLICKICP